MINEPLPSFLDRKKWTDAQWRRSAKAWEKALAAEREEQAKLAQKLKEAKEARLHEKQSKEAKAKERAAVAEAREKRRLARNATLSSIRCALDRGPVTANAMRQLVAEDRKALVPWALRTMLKQGEVKKTSRQTYERNRKC